MFSFDERIKRAQQLRTMSMIGAEQLPDGQAARVPTLYPDWKAGKAVEVGARRYYAPTDLLYACLQAHTTQADWTPDITPSLWSAIDEEHAGTPEDPVPAVRGMTYEYGLYYLDPEDGLVYLCERGSETGTIVLHYLPHELVGNYFTAASV